MMEKENGTKLLSFDLKLLTHEGLTHYSGSIRVNYTYVSLFLS